jgi:hypothetical protein
MDTADLYLAVRLTARLSALLFAVALIAPFVLPMGQRQRRSQAPFVAFMAAHTVHFGFVIGLVLATGGEGMFPGGRDVADAGGLPAVFGIFAFFYLLAGVALVQRRAGPSAGRMLHLAGRFATAFLGYMFVSTYVPLVARSPWYALPTALVATAVVLDLFAGKLRRMSCLRRAP